MALERVRAVRLQPRPVRRAQWYRHCPVEGQATPPPPPPGPTPPQVDVEGYEPIVMQSARQLLSRRTVTHVVFEYNTGPWAHVSPEP